jgi:hypothetical protein
MYTSYCPDDDDLRYAHILAQERREVLRAPEAGAPPEKGEPTDCESVGLAENEEKHNLDNWKSETKQLEESVFNEQKTRVEDFGVREREKAQSKRRAIALADNVLGAMALALNNEVTPEEFKAGLRGSRNAIAEIQKEEKLRLPPFADASTILEAPPEPEPPQLIEGILHQGVKASWLAQASR